MGRKEKSKNMKNTMKKLTCLVMSALIMLTSVFVFDMSAFAGAISGDGYRGCDYSVEKGKTIQFDAKASMKYEFSIDDPSIASVSDTGLITGKKAGFTLLKVKKTYTYSTTATPDEDIYTVGVSDKNYYTPGEYVIGKEMPAGEYVFVTSDLLIDNSHASWAFYSIYSNKNKLVDAEIFNNVQVRKVSKGQKLSFHSCYAVPFKKASSKLFNINAISKKGDGSFKVGKGISEGTYKFTPKKINGKKQYAQVRIYKGSDKKKRISFKSSTKSFNVKLKKGQYVYVSGCTMKKVK